MKYLIFSLAMLLSASSFAQDALTTLTGTWKALCKIETETVGGNVTEENKEMYQPGEKSYTFSGNSLTISQGFGKHTETLPFRVQDKLAFIGKGSKNKQPYVVSLVDKKLTLTKTEQKEKKGKTKTKVEVLTLEK